MFAVKKFAEVKTTPEASTMEKNYILVFNLNSGRVGKCFHSSSSSMMNIVGSLMQKKLFSIL